MSRLTVAERANLALGPLRAEEDFWRFVFERHAIYHRRFVERRFPPWTFDEYLRAHHFTNVYRELDPGTVYIQAELDRWRHRPYQEQILNVWLYRFAFHERSWDRIGWRILAGFDAASFTADLAAAKAEMERDGAGSIYHSAYYINNYGSRPIPKHEAVGLMAGLIAEALRGDVGERLWAAKTREEWLTTALELVGFGDFITNQVLADLTYPGRDSHLPEDGHVLLGTGARRGLRVAAGYEEDDRELDEPLLREILDGLWARQPEIPHGKRLTRMNLQNCCCEFSKWSRLRRTGGKAGSRRRFDEADRVEVQQQIDLMAVLRDSIEGGR